MKPQTREQNLAAAFLEKGFQIGDFKFRPFGAMTLEYCKMMRLTMFVEDQGGDDEKDKLADDGAIRQIVAFAWLQSAPLDDVIDHLDAQTWERAVKRYGLELPVTVLTELSRKITASAVRVNAAAVEVVPKPGAKDEERDAPPNS